MGNDKMVLQSRKPTDEEITKVISEIINHHQSGLASSLHHQYYISKVRKLFQDEVDVKPLIKEGKESHDVLNVATVTDVMRTVLQNTKEIGNTVLIVREPGGYQKKL